MGKIRFTPEAPAPEKGESKIRFEPDQVQPFAGERADAAQAGQNFTSEALAPLDVVSSAMREGESEFLKNSDIVPDLRTLNPIDQLTQNVKAAGIGGQAFWERLKKNLQHTSSPAEAPTHSDIIKRELNENPATSILLNDKEKAAAAGITGFAADIAMPSGEAAAIAAAGKIPKVSDKLKAGLQAVTGGLKNIERKQFAKVLAKFETMAQFKDSKIDPDALAAVMVDLELTPHASNPAKLHEALTGEKRTNYVEVLPGLSKEVKDRKQGIIGRKSEAMRDELYDLAEREGLQTQVPEFGSKIKAEQTAILKDPTSGRVYTPEEVEQRKKIVDGILKPYEEVIVPGVPLETAFDIEKKAVPPPAPLENPDLLPVRKFEDGIKEPVIPERPNHPGMKFPGGDDMPSIAGQVPAPIYPPKPERSQIGVTMTHAEFDRKWDDWVDTVEKMDTDHRSAIKAAQAQDSGRNKVLSSLRDDVNKIYDTAIQDWDSEVNRLRSEYYRDLKKARKLDKHVEDLKVKQAADRFMEKAKRNKRYRTEIMEADQDFYEKVQQSLRGQVFNQPRSWSLEDMMTLRSNLGKRMSSKDFLTNNNLSVEKEVVESIYHQLQDEISKMVGGKEINLGGRTIDAAEYYKVQSNAVRRMMEASEILKGAALNEYKNPDQMANLMSLLAGGGTAATGFAAANMMDMNPSFPLSLAGAGATMAAARLAKKGTPSFMAKGANLARKGVEAAAENPQTAIKGLQWATRQIRDNYVMPNPGDEGYVPPQTSVPRRFKSLPQSLIEAPLERDPEALWEKRDFVLAKVAQQSPDFFPMVSGAVKNKEQFQKVMGFLANAPAQPDPAAPSPRDMFVQDKYSMWDGRILDPQMKMMAMDDTRNNDDLNSIQKAKLLNKIQKGDRIV